MDKKYLIGAAPVFRSCSNDSSEPFILLGEAIEWFKRRIEEVDRESQKMGSAVSAELEKETADAVSEVLRACEEFERGVKFNKSLINDAQRRFRSKTDAILSKSHFISYARTWPSGFPGDYKILEYAYSNVPASEGMGYYLDTYCLSTTLCVAVRERKRTLRVFLEAELKKKQTARVLDIACGSCRELLEMAMPIAESEAKITCIDFDPNALTFAAGLLSPAGLLPDRVALRKYSILKMVNRQKNLKEFGLQDVVYSVGLFDYIQDDVLIRLVNALYELLAPGGRLIVSFKDSRAYKTQFYHWMVTWDAFEQRDEEDCRRLFWQAGIPAAALDVKRSGSEAVLFFIVKK